MWIYYSSLLIIVIVCQKVNMQMPASVLTVLNAIAGVINISSFDKKMVAEKIKIDASEVSNGGLLANLGGVALASTVILLIITALLVV
jgi:hypothetical protein